MIATELPAGAALRLRLEMLVAGPFLRRGYAEELRLIAAACEALAAPAEA